MRTFAPVLAALIPLLVACGNEIIYLATPEAP